MGKINYTVAMIYGNVDGIKKAYLWALEKIMGESNKAAFIDRDVLSVVADFSYKANREVSVFINRSGRVMAIGIGDSRTVPLADVSRRRDKQSLQAIRCIHTHPGGSGKLSDVDISALKQCKYDCIAAVGINSKGTTDMQVAYTNGGAVKYINVPVAEDMPDDRLLSEIISLENESKKEIAVPELGGRCLLVGVDSVESLQELKCLADTAGLTTVGRTVQKRSKPDIKYYVGSGKLSEIGLQAQVLNADTIIFDVQLSAMQLDNIAAELGRRVIDRSNLILHIFEKHTTTNEGRLQVRLARLKYELPMLVGQGADMSRQRGGLYALGGGGETKLELDRRNIKKQIKELTEKLASLSDNRDIRRKKRKETGIKCVTLLGYTNAGKSSVMNSISHAGVMAENKLFATLDSVSRSVWTEKGSYLLTDTVGFIRNLPHTFVEAFKSTLDEVRYADLLLHIVDCSGAERDAQIETVIKVLQEIGATDVPIITVFNKVDLLPRDTERTVPAVYVSAATGEGIEGLKKQIEIKLFGEGTDGEYTYCENTIGEDTTDEGMVEEI